VRGGWREKGKFEKNPQKQRKKTQEEKIGMPGNALSRPGSGEKKQKRHKGPQKRDPIHRGTSATQSLAEKVDLHHQATQQERRGGKRCRVTPTILRERKGKTRNSHRGGWGLLRLAGKWGKKR